MKTQDSEHSEASEDIDEQIDHACRRLDLATGIYQKTGDREPLLRAIRHARRVEAKLLAKIEGDADA